MKNIEKYLIDENKIKGFKFKKISSADRKNYRKIIFEDAEGNEIYPAILHTGLTHDIFQKVIKMIEKVIEPYK